MSYEYTAVAVGKSQAQIRRMVLGNGGLKIAIVSEPPREGFQAVIKIDAVPYVVRMMAECRDRRNARLQEQEEKRVWRVLYHHLKATFEASRSGVIDIRELLLPFMVGKGGRTLGEVLVPQLAEVLGGNPSRLLTAGTGYDNKSGT